MIWIILILTVVILVFFISNNKPKSIEQQVAEIDVPNPENSHPKKVINFINDNQPGIIKQVHEQLTKLNKVIPSNLETAFQEKMRNGYIQKEKYLWESSMEEYDIVQNEIESLNKTYTFEIKGLQNYAYRKAIKNCIKYEEVFLENEPKNKFDKNAIKIFCVEGNLGYVPATETTEVSEIISKNYKAYLESIFENDNFIEAYVIVYHA
jgi:hypothetical protein